MRASARWLEPARFERHGTTPRGAAHVSTAPKNASWRERKTIWTALVALVAMAVVALGGAGNAFAVVAGATDPGSTAPWIQSDRPDYAPGDTVTLTGGNWQAGEGVHIVVNDDIGQTWSYTADVSAGASGAI